MISFFKQISMISIGFIVSLVIGIGQLHATETENLNIQILPKPGMLVVDGKFNDWDLSGGIFVCGDVEGLRDKMGLWIHTMHDAENLYVLARFKDPTPMSNPGSVVGDPGFAGDSLQLRIVSQPDEEDSRSQLRGKEVCWVTAWRDRDTKDIINLYFPRKKEVGSKSIKNAKIHGAQQAFSANPDGKGYVQEIALPWKLLSEKEATPKTGEHILFSVEANFNTSAKFRIALKDIFRPGVTPDRVFTFRAVQHWGQATLSPIGQVTPQKLRLADNREFKVSLQDGLPVIDWTGLFEAKKMEGFAKIDLDMPEDGYVSLNIKNAEGQVVRQLLTANFITKGTHELLWDGLTNMSHLKPGVVVEPGAYTWEAIYHSGIGLRLVGWAHNAGRSPFDTPGGNWGGDHGPPSAVTTDGKQMYLGWSGSEAGKALVVTDFNGKVKWRHKEGGFGGASHIAVGNGIVYVHSPYGGLLYRLDSKKGQYSPWKGKDSAMLEVGKDLKGLAYSNGKIYYSQGDALIILDAETGEEINTIKIEKPADIEATTGGIIYLLSNKNKLLQLQTDGKTKVVIDGLKNARGLALGSSGEFYIGMLDPDNQVKVFSAQGKELRVIGKKGGRPLVGPWHQDGMRFIKDLVLDPKGNLWVAEYDKMPKRFSVWNAKTGTFVKEFFGPTGYGAPGGAICPDDPLTMVGNGSEWKLDPKTGRAQCTGVFHRGDVTAMGTSRFGHGPGGKLYVAVGGGYSSYAPVFIYERIGEGDYKLRTRLDAITNRKGRYDHPVGRIRAVRVWSDANDDQLEQAGEVRQQAIQLGGWISGWYMPMTPSLTFFGGDYRVKPTSWTACGAPQYDLSKAVRLPAPDESKGRRGGAMGICRSMGTTDGSKVIYNGPYGQNHSDFPCYDINTGKLLWSYPNNYTGVHGGHKAPPKQVGMIRATYDFIGTGRLPDPIGDIFVIATDKGEWHILSAEGYYLTSLFESDPLKIQWPNQIVPGAILDKTPPGLGAEDFGGSMMVTQDGKLYIQHGKTAFINSQVVGLDSVKRLPGGKLTVTQADLAKANSFRNKIMQASVGLKKVTVKNSTITFTGDLQKDFSKSNTRNFQKTRADKVDTAIAYDDTNLYLGWQVTDATPWVNGASDPAQMYAMGDTVDFQLGTDAKADPKRKKPVLGDLRVSIGNLNGKPTAVIYRPVANKKTPKKFISGVWRDGIVYDSVLTLSTVKIKVKVGTRGYTVEAVISLKDLGLTPKAGLTLSGDFGVTFGDPSGQDTVLRSHWSNQATGIVADEVAELMLEPKRWGLLSFE